MKKTTITLALILSICTMPYTDMLGQTELPDGFIGTYTKKEGHVDGKAAGVYALYLDEGRAITRTSLAAEVVNPSYVAVSNNKENVYAVSEIGGEDMAHGLVYRFKINENGELVNAGSAATSGMYPCYVSTDSKDRLIFVANYGGGVDIYSVENGLERTDQITLSGGTNHPRQESSHPHMARLSPDDKYLYVVDLGSNGVWIFDVDYVSGKVTPSQTQAFIPMPEDAGPRHLSFNPANGDVYVINELNNTIVVFDRDLETGDLEYKQSVSTLPAANNTESYTADIHVHPGGKFVYGSNRGHNSIVVYAVGRNGKLIVMGFAPTRGDYPRNFTIDPSGDFLFAANQNTDNIVRFRINPVNGSLKFVDEVKVKTPVCIALRN